MANPRPCDGALAGAPMSVFSLPKTVASAEFPERCGLASRSGSVVRDFGGTSYEGRVRSSLVVSKWLDTTSIWFLPKHSMHKRVSHGKDKGLGCNRGRGLSHVCVCFHVCFHVHVCVCMCLLSCFSLRYTFITLHVQVITLVQNIEHLTWTANFHGNSDLSINSTLPCRLNGQQSYVETCQGQRHSPSAAQQCITGSELGWAKSYRMIMDRVSNGLWNMNGLEMGLSQRWNGSITCR